MPFLEQLSARPVQAEASGMAGHPFRIEESEAGAKARAGLMLEQIRRKKGTAIIQEEPGIARIGANDIELANIVVKDFLSTVKAAGLLVRVKDKDMGILVEDGTPCRYLLVKTDKYKPRD